MKRKLEFILKHNPLIMKLYIIIGSTFFKICGLFIKTDDYMILFTSFSGKQYSDSPKEIYEYIKQKDTNHKYRCVWAFERPEEFKNLDCEKIKIDTWQYFFETLRAKYWVTSVNIERGLKYKKKSTIYLNTWHGPAINLMGNAVKNRIDFQWNHIDYFCISGEYEREIICRDFCVKPESILLSGLPRNDALYSMKEAKKNQLRRKFNIPDSKKVILYAPTWRESTDGGDSCTLTPPIDFKKWRKMLAAKYILLIREHVNTQKLVGIQYDDFIRNQSNYPIVNDLLMVADYLISDYSSIILDYSILCRPIICFGYDYETYTNLRGGFYFDLDKEIPSGICHTEQQVLNYILTKDYEQECKKVMRFRDRYVQVGGHATEICVNRLLK